MTNPISQISPFSVPSMTSVDPSSLPILQKAFELQPKEAVQALSQATGSGSAQMMSLHAARALNGLDGTKTHTDAELKQVSQNFESIFINMMLTEMRNSVEKSDLMGNSQATQFFQSLQDEDMSKDLSTSGGIGIGDMVYQQLKKATEANMKAFS